MSHEGTGWPTGEAAARRLDDPVWRTTVHDEGLGRYMGDHGNGTERHRVYFERETMVGRRIVFEWNPVKRWPMQKMPSRDYQVIEGVQFRNTAAAARFDLGQVDGPALVEPEQWPRFETWEQAQLWVRQPSPTPESEDVMEDMISW